MGIKRSRRKANIAALMGASVLAGCLALFSSSMTMKMYCDNGGDSASDSDGGSNGGGNGHSRFSSGSAQKARMDGQEQKQKEEYVPASTEEYIMTHFEELRYGKGWEDSKGCPIWASPEESTQENYDNLQSFLSEIDDYSKAIQKDLDGAVPNFLKTMRREGHTVDQQDLCKAARPHPDGLQALFPSHQLSQTPSGYVEPLLTPMRHPLFCDSAGTFDAFRIDYIVHDFEQMCLNLKPHSRAIFVDMGASLQFHTNHKVVAPVVALLESFEKFGFQFDHIYALEITATDPNKVYKDLLPEKYFDSYHWINTGVSSDPEDRLNPLRSIINKFEEDDLIIVKLDIDTSHIEVPLANQLLEDDSINKLVDHFYFEHHVEMHELHHAWHKSWSGTVKDSFELMNGLRKKGVASHFWV